jgi:hypothetical protein
LQWGVADPWTLDLIAPALGLGASGALLAFQRPDRRGPWVATPLAPLPVLAGFLGLGVAAQALATGTTLAGLFRWMLGLGAALGSIAALWTAVQLRRHVQLLRRSQPVDVDATTQTTAVGQWVVLAGRLGAAGGVWSPGGVRCAFYDAELRSPDSEHGGAVLTRERGASLPITLCGERGRVEVSFSPHRAAAPVESRRSRVQVEEGPLLDLVSSESVGPLGADALGIGRLERDSRGEWRLVGAGGGGAPLVLAGQRETAARRWKAEERRWLVVAVPLAALAAVCLGHLAG